MAESRSVSGAVSGGEGVSNPQIKCPYCEKQISIAIETPIDLGKRYRIMIDSKPYKVQTKEITGSKIKILSSIPFNYGVWLKSDSPADDIEIDDNDKVELSDTRWVKVYTGIRSITFGDAGL